MDIRSGDGFVRCENKGITYYSAPALEKTGLVKHAYSTRTGGVSSGLFKSLNLSILTEDDRENVLENRRRFLGILGIDADCAVGAHQVHEDNIYRVSGKDKGRGAFDPESVITATDALMTDETGLALTAFFADCIPVFFLDPRKKVIALAHAGWKGTVAKIAVKTVRAMLDTYGCASKDILVAIGPGIGPCHYEVDEPVIARFKQAFPRYWNELFVGETVKLQEGRGQLNLWEANRRQLIEEGVPDTNITNARICTYCHQSEFFSHRAGFAGRQAAVIMLNP